MPELPEVETSRRGIEPHVQKQKVAAITIRQPRLRWPIPPAICTGLTKQRIQQVARRGKYLLLKTVTGTAIIHLGMSGSLRIVPKETPFTKHDHVDIVFSNGSCLRFNDPRRFGALLWTTEDPLHHPLLSLLGPEPLEKQFNGAYLFAAAKKRRIPIKQLIMDSHIVVGVGNIYANEALFLAGIHPLTSANQISLVRYQQLVRMIKLVLRAAIRQGGTTIRNFQRSDGKPGYFKQKLFVYGRGGKECKQCCTILSEIRLGQRSSVFCAHCQT